MVDLSDLIGIPYLDHGRSKLGYDCYGLVIEVLGRMGIEIPDFDYIVPSDQIFSCDAGIVIDSGRVKKIQGYTEGAIILFKNSRGMRNHIGVYVGDGRFIHCNRNGVRIDPVDSYPQDKEIYLWLN